MWNSGIAKKEVRAKITASYDERLLDPKRARETRSGKIASDNSKMFNAEGELNAYDRKDAVTQQQRFAELTARHRNASSKQASLYTKEEKDGMMAALANHQDENERKKFGAQMIPLILDRLDYEGFIRQVFRTHEVQQGQIINYEKDVDTEAYVIQEDGSTIQTYVKGDRAFPHEYMVTAHPVISMMEIAQRQYDIVDRTHEKTTRQIMMTEDRNGIRLIDEASDTMNNITGIPGTVDKAALEGIQKEIEQHRLFVTKFLFNRQELGDLKININSLDYDPITSRDVLLTGLFANIWGTNIYVTAGKDEGGLENVSVPEGHIYAVTDGQYLGAMPIRQELTIMEANQFVHGKPQYGWLFAEIIGQMVFNPRAVAKGIKAGAARPAWLD